MALTFHGTKESKKNPPIPTIFQLAFVCYLFNGGSIFSFFCPKNIDENIGEGKQYCAGLPEECSEAQRLTAFQDRDGGSQMAREGGRDYSLFPFQKIYLATGKQGKCVWPSLCLLTNTFSLSNWKTKPHKMRRNYARNSRIRH